MNLTGNFTFDTLRDDHNNPIFDSSLSAELVSVDLWRLLWEGDVKTGGYRAVFLPTCFPEYAIKIERNPEVFQNILENEAWKIANEHYKEHAARFMAPVVAVSINQRILVQKRVTRMLESCDFCRPHLRDSMVPAWFLINDPHMENFGFIGDQLVCLDYGFIDVPVYMRAPHIPFKEFSDYIFREGKLYVDRSIDGKSRSHQSKSTASRPSMEKVRKELDRRDGLIPYNRVEGNTDSGAINGSQKENH